MVAATEVNSVDLQRSPGKFGEVTRERIRRLVDLVRRRFLTCGASSFRVAERPSRSLYSLWTSAASPSGLRDRGRHPPGAGSRPDRGPESRTASLKESRTAEQVVVVGRDQRVVLAAGPSRLVARGARRLTRRASIGPWAGRSSFQSAG